MNQLFFGDNLQVLREHLQDESVDLNFKKAKAEANAAQKELI